MQKILYKILNHFLHFLYMETQEFNLLKNYSKTIGCLTIGYGLILLGLAWSYAKRSFGNYQ